MNKENQAEELNDYSYEPQSDGGKYLRLKTKGQKIRIRLASKPYKYFKEFTDKDSGEKNLKELFAWAAVDKTEAPFKGKAFTGGLMIYIAIKRLAQSEDWGDPTGYDLVIERTEIPGSYYTVSPVPKGMGPITKEDLALIADINLAEMFADKELPKDKKSLQNSDEYDAFADE